MSWVFDRLKFKQKLLLSYLIVIIIPILVLGIYSYVQSMRLLNVQAMQGVEKNIETAADSIGYRIEHFNNLVYLVIGNRAIQGILSPQNEGLANLSELSTQLKDILDPYFSMLLTMNQGITRLTLFTERDIPEYGDYLRSSTTVLEESWYKEAVAKFGVQWHVDRSGNDSGTEVVLVSKFPETFESGSHLLYMRLETAKIVEEAAKLLLDYPIIIKSRDGSIVFSSISEDVNSSHTSNADVAGGVSMINGKEMMVFEQDIAKSMWTLYCFVPVGQVSGNAAPILYATFIVIGICIVILIVIISIFANGMIRRIYRLNSWMKRVEKGELEIDVYSTSHDEIGELTKRFGNMLLRINELLHEVRHKELIALQAQMNPHFLYNTLSAINWKALQTKSYEISRIVTALSKFYRTALNKGDDFISIRHEVENVKSYLDIMLNTNDNSFDVMYDIDEAVFQYDTVKMLLQPLAENAIIHGLNLKEKGEGRLTVSVSMGEGTVEFAIMDNGPGMELDVLYKVRKMQTSGYGLRNVNERIRLHFGTGYGLSVQSDPGHGTTMSISIPVHTRQ